MAGKSRGESVEVDTSLADDIRKILDNLAGLSDEEAKNSFRRIFSLLNFSPAFNTIYVPVKYGSESIELKAEIIATTQPEVGEPFRIVYLTVPKLTKTLRRAIVRGLVDWDERYANFIAIMRSGNYWEIVSPVYFSKTDRLELRVYTAGEGYSHRTLSLALAQIRLDKADKSSIEVREIVNNAFKVKALTEDFFEEYKRYYNILKKTVLNLYQSKIEKHYKKEYGLPKEVFVERVAKTFTHSLLNRLMFVYFLQKKGWLGGIKNFVVWLWDNYEKTLKRDEDGKPVLKTEFYSHYLRPLFFDALNKPRNEKRGLFSHLPKEVSEVFEDIPFFNGGLFEKAKEGDVVVDDIIVELPDQAVFELIFNFLEEYNFTVSEKTPLDVEIAVDPAMLGHIYESLIAQEEGARESSGIFYTPEAEVHFMVRLALLEYLLTKLYERHGNGEDEDSFRKRYKERLVRFIWGSPEEGVRPPYEDDVIDLITRVKIVDPACGSGAFLVATYTILRELYRKLGLETTYEYKKRIIRENIYGVDIKSWATRVAELRLWLALIEDEESLPERPVERLPDGSLRELPILPNLKANVKTADSIVAKEIQVNGKNLVLPRKIADRFRTGIGKISEKYRQEIEKIFNGAVKNPERELEEVKKEIFREFIEAMYAKGMRVQSTLDGGVIHEFSDVERKLIKELYNACRSGGSISIPFIWQVDFAGVFAEGGFDIVVSNPPYVRQEKIYPESYDLNEFNLLSRAEQNKLKKWYKNAVKEAVKEAVRSIYGEAFELPGRSDLYAYFFVYSTMLLKPHGVLVYITSNSWLDVEFGLRLQEFILRYGKLRYVIDSLYRSFEQADINTVITAFQRKDIDEASILDNHFINFVLLKKTFEEIITDDVVEITSTYPLYVDRSDIIKEYELFGANVKFYESALARIRYITEKGLAKLGESKLNGESLGGYKGEKWGGLLIRAPEIFYRIVDKNKDKLVRLGEVAEVKFGIKTGANDFFYLRKLDKRPVCPLCGIVHEEESLVPVENGAGWKGYIEKGFLRPVIKSSQQLSTLQVSLEDSNLMVFMCHSNPNELQKAGHAHALKYIRDAEEKLWSCTVNSKHPLFYSEEKKPCLKCGAETYHFYMRPTVSGNEWWKINLRKISDILCMAGFNDRFAFWINGVALCDKRLYDIYVYKDDDKLLVAGLLNSTFTPLQIELFATTNLGEGALDFKVYEAEKLLILKPEILRESKLDSEFEQIVRRMANREVKSIFEELGLPKPNDDLSNINPEDVKLDKVLPDRRELDKIVFEVLGLTEEEQLEVYKAVVELVKARLVKAQSV